MHSLLSIPTPRLTLRPFTTEDAPRVAELCNDRRITDTTLVLPYPYELAHATSWIGGLLEDYAKGAFGARAITLNDESAHTLIGCIGGSEQFPHQRFEVGYWTAPPYWGCGYATEALRATIDHLFQATALNRIQAYHFENNPASGRVLAKAGLRPEGIRRQYVFKNGRYIDCPMFAILRQDWQPAP